MVVREVKGQKIPQNEKQQLHLLRTISKEQYIIRLSFMVQIYKMIISQGVFFNVKNLIF